MNCIAEMCRNPHNQRYAWMWPRNMIR